MDGPRQDRPYSRTVPGRAWHKEALVLYQPVEFGGIHVAPKADGLIFGLRESGMDIFFVCHGHEVIPPDVGEHLTPYPTTLHPGHSCERSPQGGSM